MKTAEETRKLAKARHKELYTLKNLIEQIEMDIDTTIYEGRVCFSKYIGEFKPQDVEAAKEKLKKLGYSVFMENNYLNVNFYEW